MYSNIFDTHAHYDDSRFDEDRDRLLTSLPAKGVSHIVNCGCDLKSSLSTLALSEKYDFIYAALGVHAHEAEEATEEDLQKIAELYKNKKVAAVGEIGLDYHYEGFDKEKQIELFAAQLKLAAELNLPVIVHSRDATEDTLRLLKEYRPKGVLHCFSGSAETAKEIIKLDMYIGFTGVITFKNARKALEALEVVPNDRLVLETDCPYMAPVPFRGKRCDSSMITYMAEKAAEIKGITPQEILDITCKNGLRLFEIDI